MKRLSLFAILILIGIILWQCAQEKVEPLSSKMVEELAGDVFDPHMFKLLVEVYRDKTDDKK